MKKIGIIGGGPAGLCALKYFSKDKNIDVILWEKSSCIGGLWKYEEISGTNVGLEVHSSMYDSLRTDIPKVIMQFRDFPFDSDVESFPHHTKVLDYLQKYAIQNELHSYIQLNTSVENVKPIDPGSHTTNWEITTKNLESNITNVVQYDAIIICNGHFSVPNEPTFKGIEEFKGTIIHSHFYRKPNSYQDRTVLLIGLGASAMDISIDVAKVAKQVYISHRYPKNLFNSFPSNVYQVGEGIRFDSNSMILENNEHVYIDDVIYCTGYKYQYPFLDRSCRITVEENAVKELHMDVINVHFNTMAFIGIPSQVLSFPLFEYQVQYFQNYIQNKMTLPTPDEMSTQLEEKLAQYKAENKDSRHFHRYRDEQWSYMDTLAETAGLEKMSKSVRNIFNTNIEKLFLETTRFKDYVYEIIDQDCFAHSYAG